MFSACQFLLRSDNVFNNLYCSGPGVKVVDGGLFLTQDFYNFVALRYVQIVKLCLTKILYLYFCRVAA